MRVKQLGQSVVRRRTWKTVVDLWANWEKQDAREEAALLPCRCNIPKSLKNMKNFLKDWMPWLPSPHRLPAGKGWCRAQPRTCRIGFRAHRPTWSRLQPLPLLLHPDFQVWQVHIIATCQQWLGKESRAGGACGWVQLESADVSAAAAAAASSCTDGGQQVAATVRMSSRCNSRASRPTPCNQPLQRISFCNQVQSMPAKSLDALWDMESLVMLCYDSSRQFPAVSQVSI